MPCSQYGGPDPGLWEQTARESAPSVIKTIVKTLLSIFLSVLVFAALVGIVALTVARPENISEAASQADLAWILDEAGLSEEIASSINARISDEAGSNEENSPRIDASISGEVGLSEENSPRIDASISDEAGLSEENSPRIDARILGEAGLSEEIVDSIDLSQLNNFGIDADSINDFLSREGVREEISKVADQYITALTEGNLDYHITSEEIVGFLGAIAPDLSEEFDITLTDNDYNMITDSLNNDELKEYSAGKLLNQANMTVEIPYLLLSDYPLIALGIFCALMAFNIFLLHRKKIRTAFLYTGMAIALAGLMFIVAALLSGPFSGLLHNSDLYKVIRLTVGFSAMALLNGLICLGGGIVFIGIFMAIKTVSKNGPPARPVGKGEKGWLYFGLAVNIIALIFCAMFTLLCLKELPKEIETANAYLEEVS